MRSRINLFNGSFVMVKFSAITPLCKGEFWYNGKSYSAMIKVAQTTFTRFCSSWTTSKSLLEELNASWSSWPSSQPTTPTSLNLETPTERKPPLLMLPKPQKWLPDPEVLLYRFFNPVDKDIVFVRKHKEIPDGARPLMSSKGWVSLVDPRDGALYVWDPVSCKNKNSGCRLLKLPSVATLPSVLDVEYDNNCGFSTPSIKKFTLQCYCSKPNHTYEETSFNVCTNNMLASACFSTAPDDDVNHCIGMAFQGDISPTLHFSEIGGSAWKCLDAPFSNYAQVIASSKKKNVFFALSDAGEIEAWDLRNLSDIKRTFLVESYRLPCFESHISGPNETDFQGQTYSKKEVDYLLESLEGDLLMVTRHIAEYPDPTRDIPAYHETLKFDVHKLDFGRKKWEKLSCLSDCALFVGINSESFSVRASDYPGIQENSIYFAPADEHSFYGGLDIGVFNLADKEVDRFNQLRAYKAPRGWRSRTRPPFWVAPSATTYLYHGSHMH